MIYELLITILPSLIVLIMIYLCLKIGTDVDNKVALKGICFGIICTVPAIITMKIVGVLITIFIPMQLPLLFYQIFSVLNEETYKYVFISKLKQNSNPFIFAIFIGGGFAISETLFLSLGNNHMALVRSYTSLPLHILTSILLYKSINKKYYFIIALLLHLSYNLIIKK